MLRIGITGGIGSGKTTVSKIFELMGVPVFYADEQAKQLMVQDRLLIKALIQAFGPESYLDDGTLNRKHISNIVFSDPQELEKLNSFVHPAVFRAMDAWTAQQKGPYVLKEAALLFESGSHQQNDFNILVSSPIALRISRVMKRDGISEEKVLGRIANQFPEEDKQKLADFHIKNNEQESLIIQVLKLHQTFLKRGRHER